MHLNRYFKCHILSKQEILAIFKISESEGLNLDSPLSLGGADQVGTDCHEESQASTQVYLKSKTGRNNIEMY